MVSQVAVEQAGLSKNRIKKRDKEYRIEDIRKDLAVIPGCWQQEEGFAVR